MGDKKLIGADYLLLLLFLNNRAPIFGAVRLIKMMFIFNQEIAPILKTIGLESEKLPEFIAYKYGPFAKDVYEQVELFKAISFIKETDINSKEEMGEVDEWEEAPFVDELWNDRTSEKSKGNDSWNNENIRFEESSESKFIKYEITSTGIKYVDQKILPVITREQIAILEDFKERITNISAQQLLHYVYTKYPEYTENSLIKKEVLGER